MAEKGKSTLNLNTPKPSEHVQRKRGRPRKPDAAGTVTVPQGSAVALVPAGCLPLMSAVASAPMICAAVSPPPVSAVFSPPVSQVVSRQLPALPLSHVAENSANRSQGGRPRASMSEILRDTALIGFTTHVLHINPREDVIGKILSVVQNGPRGVCILSASGTVSEAALSLPGSCGVLNIYEGQYQILSLTGSFTVAETGMGRRRMGGLSISLAFPDGSVIGGGVTSPLIAAGAVQIVVGSFLPNASSNYGRMQQEANPRHQHSRG